MADKLQTITALELLERPLEPTSWLVKDLIPNGLTILAGPPKVGKSWLAYQLALCVSLGQPFLDHETTQADVLCLFLEDTERRLQKRLFYLTDEANDSLRMSTEASKLYTGLIDQLEMYLKDYDATRLIVIDTLQTVRGAHNDSSYSADYDDVGMFKKFADEHSLAIVLVHHTRKMFESSNVFNNVSGTNGIMGVADEAMALLKENYFDESAKLFVTGRDVEYEEYVLARDGCKWVVVEKPSREDMKERSVPPCIKEVLDFMGSRSEDWKGSASQLVDDAGITDIIGQVLTKHLNQYKEYLLSRGVKYDYRRTASARIVTLAKVECETSHESGRREGDSCSGSS